MLDVPHCDTEIGDDDSQLVAPLDSSDKASNELLRLELVVAF